MDSLKYSFPAFRKYTGINVWFKITDDRNFLEIKQIGARFIMHELTATQYPEIILIQDMLACADQRWEIIEAEVFNQVAELAKRKN